MKSPSLGLVVVLSMVAACVGGCGDAQPAQSPASGAAGAVAPPASTAPTAPVAPAVAPPATASMFELQMKSLHDYVRAFNKHDAKAIAALYAPEAVFIERGDQLSAGFDAIESDYRVYFQAFPDATTAITRSWHSGDTVLFEFVEGGTNTGKNRTHKPTGKRFGYVGASVLKFKPSGEVQTDTTYADELTKEVQTGWAPAALAKLEVRPVVPVPAATDSWEVHKVTDKNADQGKVAAARKSLYTSFSLGSEKDFLAALSDDVVLSPYDDPKDAKGKREAASLFKDWTKTFSEGVVNATQSWSVDGYVVLQGTFSGKHTGAWGPLKPTNKAFKSSFLDLARLNKDDKIERVWTYANNYELLKYLGYQKEAVLEVAPHDPMAD